MHDDILQPPNSYTVDEARPILYQADGTPLKRQIGFAMQSSGTCPPLSGGTTTTITTKPPKKGKR